MDAVVMVLSVPVSTAQMMARNLNTDVLEMSAPSLAIKLMKRNQPILTIKRTMNLVMLPALRKNNYCFANPDVLFLSEFNNFVQTSQITSNTNWTIENQ